MIGIIGGSGVEEITGLADNVEKRTVETEYGSVVVSLFNIEGKDVAFLPRHLEGHSCPPHKINFKANIMALKQLGVTQIMATNAVGSVDLDIAPGSIVIIDDFLDFTVNRPRTFYDDDEAIHIDMNEPFCNRLRNALLSHADCINGNVVDGGTIVCNEGPRFETPAEIKMFRIIGVTVVGMTTCPEVVLAREKEMCYSSITIVSNYCTSISKSTLGVEEVYDIMGQKKEELIDLLHNVIKDLPEEYDCHCHHALGDAEM
ncbi:S-methyl-5'-thioadenosine phosphorylase [uncultured Methanobrevibacter sp.]|uniref:S-methyl-5'-thioadenosine phosphorylase n=1 Tax=uncultured Methanobrevibacter sp. TaxID=253161 RepID=UPI0025DA07E6|nr:S-methyl-5'-thioadenosine phosphorylase [uncultured Methanobrevibacter sp.]